MTNKKDILTGSSCHKVVFSGPCMKWITNVQKMPKKWNLKNLTAVKKFKKLKNDHKELIWFKNF